MAKAADSSVGVRVYPPVVEFEEVEENTLYVLTVFVQNVSKAPQRIRFEHPESKFFTLNYFPTEAIAPGLEVRVEVEFCMPEGCGTKQFRDRLVVRCGERSFPVELRAQAPGPRFELEGGGLVDLGTVVVGNAASKYIELRNVGSRPGKFSVIGDHGPQLSITPASGVLQPARGAGAAGTKLSERLKVDFRSEEPGIYRRRVQVEVEGQPPQTLDISATNVEHSLELVHVNNRGKVDAEMQFGSVYFGQARERTVVLVNNGPQASQYSIMFRPGEGFDLYKDPPPPDQEVEEPSEDNDNDGELSGFTNTLGERSPIDVQPCEGVLNPYQQLPITLRFAPQKPRQARGFAARGDHTLHEVADIAMDILVCCSDTHQSIPLRLAGRALKPKVHVDRKVFKFGRCPANERLQIQFSVSNRSEELAANFAFNKIAFFSAQPDSGRLLPGQAQTVTLTFAPGQMGEFKNTIHVVINDGVAVIPLSVIAKCNAIGNPKKMPGGPDAIVADFQPEVKFVDDEEVRRQEKHKHRFKRIPPWEKQLKQKQAEEEALAQMLNVPARPGLNQESVHSQSATSQASKTILNSKDEEDEEEAARRFEEVAIHADDSQDNPDEDVFGGVKSYDPQYTYSTTDLIRKQNHRDQYAGFLKRAYAARQARREEDQAKKTRAKRREQRVRRRSASNKGAPRMEEDEHSGSDDSRGGRGENSEDDPDLDMEPYGGLRSPAFKIPKGTEPLYLKRPLEEDAGTAAGKAQARRRHRTKAHDEDKLLKRKYKPKATTQAEMIDCASTISSSDLVLIEATPKVLDFGVVSVNSKNFKCLGITNDLGHNILVEVKFDEHEELAGSSPASQVIPPGAKAGFDVLFFSTTQPPENQSNKFRQTLTYVVNGQHKFKVTVCAEVIPVKLGLSHTTLNLAFEDDNLGPDTRETITLTNTGNAPARFAWVHSRPVGSGPASPTNKSSPGAQQSAFSVDPEADVIEPFQSKQVVVTFAPSSKAPKEEKLLLRVRGGYDEVLNCAGQIEEPLCSFAERKLDLGKVPVGLEQERTVELRNTGNFTAVYFIRELPEGVEVHPSRGKIPPGSAVPLRVCFTAAKPMRLDSSTHFITAQLRGGRDLHLPILCEAVLPELELATTETDFGDVTMGSSRTVPLVLDNKSAVAAVLTLDLSRHPEFDVSIAESSLKDSGYEEDDLESCLRPISAPADTAGGNRSGGSGDFEDEDFRGLEEECSAFRIKVPPAQRLTINLTFSPESEKLHNFSLPLRLTGRSAPLKHTVLAEGLRPKLMLSSTTVNFETRIVARDRIKKVPFYKDVTVTNHHTEPLHWEIDTKSLGAESMVSTGVFSVKPVGGHLEPGDSCVVKVGFMPKEEVQYSETLPIYLNEERSREYIHLTLLGGGMFPKLRFDTADVVLPTVPLGVKAMGTFTVVNDGYENLELQTKLPAESQRIPLTINFPEGRNIGVGHPEVPVEVCFMSRKPMSFTAKIDFVDQDGNRFSIRVTGTTDNCLLTAFPFVAAVRENFDFFSSDRQRPVQFLPRAQIEMLQDPMGAAQIRGSDEAEAEAEEAAAIEPRSTKQMLRKSTMMSSFDDGIGGQARSPQREGPFVADASLVETASTSPASINNMIRFLNLTAFQVPVVDFPADVVAANGRPVLDLIETLSGKTVPGRIKGALGKKKKKAMLPMLLAQYGALLKFLKSRGALLHEIRPEQFLSKEEYVRFREREFTTGDGTSAGPGGSSGLTVVMAGSCSASTLSVAHGQALHRRHLFEREYASTSLSAWSGVVLQVVKLFVLNRVTPKQYKALPCVARPSPQDLKALSVAGSNIHSVPEAILLHWLNSNHEQGTNLLLRSGGGGAPAADILPSGQVNPFAQHEPVINFDTDLSNGVALCTLVLAHVPALMQPGRVLSGVVLEPTEAGQCQANLRMLMAALKELGLDFTRNPEDMAHDVSNARDNLLFVLYLYQQLPQFVPKATVEFSCALGSKVSKSIELRNPTNRLIGYNVVLDGAQDFHVGVRSVVIEPHSSASLPVELTSRFSRPVEASLMLKPDRNLGGGGTTVSTDIGGLSSARGTGALVFSLISSVHSRKSIRAIKCSSRTYEPLVMDVEVTNPFAEDSKFHIEITQERTAGDRDVGQSQRQGGAGAGAGKKGKAGGKKTPKRKKNLGQGSSQHLRPEARIDKPLAETLPDAFTCRTTTIKLKPHETQILKVQFLPFMPGEYHCQMVFLDESVGEFLYEMSGEAGLPQPLEKVTFTTEAKCMVTKQINVGVHNRQLDKALAQLAPDAPNFTGLTAAEPFAAVLFDVEADSPFYTVAPSLFVTDARHSVSEEARSTQGSSQSTRKKASAQGGGSGGSGEDGPSDAGPAWVSQQLLVEMLPQSAGVYPCTAVLRTRTQIRVIEFECTVTTPPVQSELEFAAPARQTIQQGIPIMNTTPATWTIQALFEGDASFGGKRSLTVGPDGETAEYMLEFSPPWMGEYRGTLTMQNTTTDERMVYHLRGVATEPLAEDHVVIDCKAREKLVHNFVVSNTFGRSAGARFTVESDMPHVSGTGNIDVEAGETQEYPLTVHPLLGGTYTGSITFTLGPGKPYIWYTIEVRASSPMPEDTLEISSVVRKAVAVNITLVNPLDVAVEFDVLSQGHGLIGDSVFVLDARETAAYELVYSPLIAGEQIGSLSFVNDRVGEVWYQLHLTASEAEAVVLPPMQCAVGTTTSTEVMLDNPTEQAVEVRTAISNRQNFSVRPAVVSLAPYSQTPVNIEYLPSSVGREESSTVKFSHPELGTWEFHASGEGQQPSLMPEIGITACVGHSESSTFMFRNPFPTALRVTLSLQSETPDFQLLMTKGRATVAAFTSFMVPFSFSPKEMSEKRAVISVQAEDSGMTWTFPLCGYAEAPPHGEVFQIRTRSRDPVSQTLHIPLAGLGPISAPEPFLHELVVPEQDRRFVQRALSIVPLETRITREDQVIPFKVDFQPLRPFSTMVDLVVSRRSGGRWRFQISLTAEEPMIDDVINIQASLSQTSSVSFRLSNHFATPASFEAYLTVESAYQFAVYPTSGVLKPMDDPEGGTSFVVSFTPTEYGKVVTAKLIIATDEMLWSYQLRGTHPEYAAPAAEAKVSSHVSRKALRALADKKGSRKK